MVADKNKHFELVLKTLPGQSASPARYNWLSKSRSN
jgi:hypothetical protein